MSLDFEQMTAQATMHGGHGHAVEKVAEELPGARYESLIRLAGAIRAHRDPEKLFHTLVRELCQVVPFDAIAQYDESSNKVHWHLGEVCHRSATQIGIEPAKEETLAWWVHLHQQPLVIASVDTETRFPRMMERFREFGIRSICALPMSTVHRRLGSLLVASRVANAYAEDE